MINKGHYIIDRFINWAKVCDNGIFNMDNENFLKLARFSKAIFKKLDILVMVEKSKNSLIKG